MEDGMKPDQFVAMDRTTATDLLPMVISKAVRSSGGHLPSRDEVLAAERARLGRESLTDAETREALVNAGEYTDRDCVFRDFGNYCVGISMGSGLRVSGKPS